MSEQGASYDRTEEMPDDDGRDARIEELERRLSGLTKAFGALSIGPLATRGMSPDMIGFSATPFPSPVAHDRGHSDMAGLHTSEERARFVREHIRHRRLRDEHFRADYFADPVWDMLLDLYAAHYEGQPVAVSSLCIAAAVPATTALRWIKALTASGTFTRTRDDSDGRRVYVDLSEEARGKLDVYFDTLHP
jgi:DNA-binding MarR family transcriptional regulator